MMKIPYNEVITVTVLEMSTDNSYCFELMDGSYVTGWFVQENTSETPMVITTNQYGGHRAVLDSNIKSFGKEFYQNTPVTFGPTGSSQ